jgi:hypothetical protein
MDTKTERFEKANKKIHKVEDQWHYPIMTKYGFQPTTQEAVGFVRAYIYENDENYQIVCSTGYSADHWEDKTTGAFGYWRDLENHLKVMKK